MNYSPETFLNETLRNYISLFFIGKPLKVLFKTQEKQGMSALNWK